MRTLLLLTLLSAFSSNAQERILGLVEIPALPGFEALAANQPGIPVRAEPSTSSAEIAELRSFDLI